MRVVSLLVLLSVVLLLISFNSAHAAPENEVFVEPPVYMVDVGDPVTLEIRGKAPIGASDVYGIQFDVDYDNSLLTLNSVTEGSLLNNNGQDVTLFGYESAGSGLIDDLYIVRNDSQGTGIHTNEDVFATLGFTANSQGIAYMNLTEVIWVNSTITNETATTVDDITITNGTVNIGFNNEIFVYPSTSSYDEGDTFSIEIRGRAPVGANDVHSIQFDVEYDPSVLNIVSITEGNFLNGDGQTTLFNYNLLPGKASGVYIARNDTNESGSSGIHSDEATFIWINFETTGSGTSYINLTKILWINSSITNESAGIVYDLIVTNGTTDINPAGPPDINSKDCQIDGNWYINSCPLVFGDTLNTVRVNCTSSSRTINGVNFRFENVPDSNVFFDTSGTDIGNGYWQYNSNAVINDSGLYWLNITCTDDIALQTDDYIGVSFPWGSLNVDLITSGDRNVNQNEFFTFASGVTCNNFECGTVEATLDPILTEQWGDATGTNHPGTLEDTTLNLDANNYASDPMLYTYTWPANTIANAVILKWDLSTIPTGATVTSATLYLYQQDTGGITYTTPVHKIINYNPVVSAATGYTYDGVNGWTPNSCCDGNIPLAQADIDPAESSNTTDTGINKFVTWDVPNMVQDWVTTPLSNYGMLVNSDTGGNVDDYRFFASNEAVSPDLRPKLVITYDTDGGVPKGLVSTIPNTQPFYTTDSNPKTTSTNPCLRNMRSGDYCESSWQVNATGAVDTSYDFFTIYTPTTYPTQVNEQNTATSNVTIVSGGADLPPVVTANSPPNLFTTQHTNIDFTATVTDDNSVNTVSLWHSDPTWHLDDTNSSGIQGDYIFTKNFVNGVYTWLIEGCDNSGQCANSSTRTFTVDTTPPAQVTNLKNDTNGVDFIDWSWSNPAESDFWHIEVWLNGVFQTNTTSGYYNATSLSSSTAYVISTRTVDNLGNIGSWLNHTSHTLDVDMTPPSVVIFSPASIAYNTDPLPLEFSYEDLNSVTCKYNLNGAGSNQTIPCDNTSILNSVPGSNNLIVYVTDSYGNVGFSAVSWTYDIIIPFIGYAIITTPGGYSNSSDIIIAVDIYDSNLDSVILNWNGINETFDDNIGNTFFSLKSGLPDGVYTFYAWINDTAGNYNFTPTRIVTIDTVAPSVTITNPQNTVYSTQPTLQFTATDTNPITCAYNLNGAGNQSVACGGITPITSSQGSNNIIVYATDAAGNAAQDSVSWTYDSIPPVINFHAHTPADLTITNNATVIVRVTITEANIDEVILDWNGANESLVSIGGNDWQAVKTMSAQQAYTYYVWTDDTAGNDAATGTRSITYDSINPSVTITNPQNTVYSTQPTLQFTATDTNPITCAYNLNGAGNVPVACDATPTLASNEDSNNVIVYATDSAGNLGQDSVSWAYDTTPPGPVTGLINTSAGSDYINWIWNNPGDVDFNHVEIWLDGVFNSSSPAEEFNATGITPGNPHTISLRTVDDAGNTGSWVNDTKETMGLDTTPPILIYESPTPGDDTYWPYGSHVINVSSNEQIHSCVANVDGVNYTSPIINAGFYCEYGHSFVVGGVHTFYMFINDTSGNGAMTSIRTINIDNNPPVLSIIEPQNIAYTTEPDLQISYSDASPITCAYNLNGAGNQSMSCDIPESILSVQGSNNILVYATDAAGNVAQDSVSWTYDSIPPVINFHAHTPADLTITNNATVIVRVTITEANIDEVILDWNGANESLVSIGGNDWQAVKTMSAQQAYTYYVWTDDTAGNDAATGTRSITYDSITPSVVIFSPGNITYNTNPLPLEFSYQDTNLVTCEYVLRSGPTQAIPCDNTSTIFSNEGPNNIVVYVTDVAGNTGQDSVSWTYDTTPPQIVYNSDTTPGGMLPQGFVFVNVTVIENNIASVRLNIDGINETFDNNQGEFYWENNPLSDGMHTFYAWVLDDMGYYANTQERTITLDTTYPSNINFVTPTPNQGTTITYSNPTIAVVFTETNPASCIFQWNNGTTANFTNTSINPSDCTYGFTTSDGSVTVTVFVADAVSNINSVIRSFNLDTTPPGPVTGLINTSVGSDYIYWVWNNPGDADFNHVEIWLDGMFNSSSIAEAFNATGLTSGGLHTISLRTVDDVGNTGTWTNHSAHTTGLDATPPSVVIFSPASIAYNTDPLPLEFSYEDLNSVTCKYNLNGAGSNQTIPCDNTSILNSVPGSNNLIVYVTDSYGNVGFSAASWTYDSIPPVINFHAHTPADLTITNNATVIVRVTITEANIDEVILDWNGANESLVSIGGNDWQAVKTMSAQQAYTYYVWTDDTAGNDAATGTRSITYDIADPQISYNINTTTEGNTSNDYIFINITTTDANLNAVMVNWNGANETFDNSQGEFYWENKTALTDGVYTFYAWANDAAGNHQQLSSRTVSVDLTSPLVVIFYPQNTTYNTNPPINVSFEDVNLYDCYYSLNGQSNSTGTSCAALNGTATSSVEGPNNIIVYAEDAAGNIGSSQEFWSYDTTPPASVINLTNISTGTTYIHWTWDNPADTDFDHVEIWIDGVFNSTFTTDEFNVTGLSSGFTHTLSTRTVDVLGNINNVWVNSTSQTIANSPIVSITYPTGGLLNTTGINATYIKYGPMDDVDHARLQLDSGTEFADMQAQGYHVFTSVSDGSHTIFARLVNASNETVPSTGTTDNVTFTVDATTPLIDNVTITNVTDTSANISWDTNENTDSFIAYGTNVSTLEDNKKSSTFKLHHSMLLTELDPATLYYFNITSCDAALNCNLSITRSFTTVQGAPNLYCGDGACNNGEGCSSCPTDCGTCDDGDGGDGGDDGDGTPPPAPKTAFGTFQLEPGETLGEDQNLKNTAGTLLGSSLTPERVNLLQNMSENISDDFDGNRTLYVYNGTTNLTTNLFYDGSDSITNLIVYESLPKSFAADTSDIDVNVNTQTYGIVQQDPEYIFIYPTVATGNTLDIYYETGSEITDLLAAITNTFTEVYAETLELPACNNNGVCDTGLGENSVNCPADCSVTGGICTPSEVWCEDDELRVCSTDGKSYSRESCSAGCNSVTLSCNPTIDYTYIMYFIAIGLIAGLVVLSVYYKHRSSAGMSWDNLKKKWSQSTTVLQEEGNMFKVSTVLADPDMFIGKTVKITGNISLSSQSKSSDKWYVFSDDTGEIPVHSTLRGLSGTGTLIGMIEKTTSGQIYIELEEYVTE